MVLFALCINNAQSKEINLFSGDVKFNVPEEYKERTVSNSDVAYYAVSGNKGIALLTYRKSDFSVSAVFEKMDSMLCDLTDYKLVDTDRESFVNFTNDYVIKKYESSTGRKFASYIRYVTQGAYCFGFWYETAEEFEDFKDIIDSVHFAEENSDQVALALKYTGGLSWILLILLFVAAFFAGASGSAGEFKESAMVSLIITSIIAALFIFPLWGFWYAYLILLLVFYVICFLCAISGSILICGED